MNTTTVRELGQRMPIGYALPNGELSKEFSIVEPVFGHIRKTTEETQKNISASGWHGNSLLLKQIEYFLSLITTEIGPSRELDRKEFAAAISKVHLSDVLYMYVWSRIVASGPIFVFNERCSNDKCKNTLHKEVDLYELEVDVLEKIEPKTIKLPQPWAFRGNIIERVEVSPHKWNAFVVASQATNGSADIALTISAISGLYGTDKDGNDYARQNIPIAVGDLDALKIPAQALLIQHAVRIAGGLKFKDVVTCDECGASVAVNPLGSVLFDFFGSSAVTTSS